MGGLTYERNRDKEEGKLWIFQGAKFPVLWSGLCPLYCLNTWIYISSVQATLQSKGK